MLAKWKLEMLGILASLSLVSVGFSTWNISATIPITNTVQGNLQADYVIKTDEYVYFDKDGDKQTTPNDGIVLPEYNQYGFIVPDAAADGGYSLPSDTNLPNITLYLTVYGDKCNTNNPALNGDSYLQITCEMSLKDVSKTVKDKELNFFKMFNLSPSSNGINIEWSYISSSSNDYVGISLLLTDYNFSDLQKTVGNATITQNGLIKVTLSIAPKEGITISGEDIYKFLDGNYFIFNMDAYTTSTPIKSTQGNN